MHAYMNTCIRLGTYTTSNLPVNSQMHFIGCKLFFCPTLGAIA